MDNLRPLMRVLAALVVTIIVHTARAEEGPIAGLDLGLAVPVGRLHDRADIGGVFSPYAGYMFNDYLGLTGQVQVVGAPNKSVAGIPDSDAAALFGALVGPRLELPLRDHSKPTAPGEIVPILHFEGQAGLFTGLAGGATSGTSWGYSAGTGINFRISDPLLVGGFVRYNWVDQRVTGEAGERGNLDYVTVGFGLTYNLAPPPSPPPPPAIAQAPPAAPVRKKIILRGVHFDFDKASIRSADRPVLDEAIATLKREGGIAVITEGHTDSKGSDDYNMKLSLRRAQAVRDYLVKGGIAANRVSSEGFGESHPVATNATDDGRAQNRRVELRIRGD